MRIQLEENQQKFKTYHKFEGSSKRLDEILENQIPSNVKHGIGFEKGESSKRKNLNLPNLKNKPLKNFDKSNVVKNETKDDNEGCTRVTHQRKRNFVTNFQQRNHSKSFYVFNGYCFNCNNYGHKISNC